MRTKIYGTIGPACCETHMLVRLFEKGMTGIRINLSHSNLKDAQKWIENIHTAYRSFVEANATDTTGYGKMQPLEILMDLRGPELRIGTLAAERRLAEGDMITLVPQGKNNLFDPTEIPVPEIVLPHIKEGEQVSLDDGKIRLLAEECNYGIECRVLRGGVLKSNKSIALTDNEIALPTLTESDYENIKTAKTFGITGVMLPFVRGKEDLLNLKEALVQEKASDIRIFAKIENREGVEQLPELLPHCDEIVIARGDLGNAMPLWELPVTQEKIAVCCKKEKKPFMVVTQMLASMEQTAVPTRAEVSDIFRAVQEGAASVMLTGETAAGDYPIEAMEYLCNTVQETEKYFLDGISERGFGV